MISEVSSFFTTGQPYGGSDPLEDRVPMLRILS